MVKNVLRGTVSLEHKLKSVPKRTVPFGTFNLTSFNATDNLKVHLFKTNGEEVIVELEKVK